jgi:hypothetical protein
MKFTIVDDKGQPVKFYWELISIGSLPRLSISSLKTKKKRKRHARNLS